MAPPKFGDVGKAANDLFNDDFGAGSVKLTLKSKAANGVVSLPTVFGVAPLLPCE